MRSIAELTKTTLIGGVLVILPIYLSILLLLKALAGVGALISPITQGLPESLPFRDALAALILIVACFVCGVLVRTGPGLRAKNKLESAVLEKIPGYALIRGIAGRIAGKEDESTFTIVLAEIEDALVPAFLVEECDDEHYAIFVPSVPTPAAGSIYIIAKARVHLVDAPFTQAVSVISKWGSGASGLFAAMKRSERSIGADAGLLADPGRVSSQPEAR
jgi:uncharacterized membrane protein